MLRTCELSRARAFSCAALAIVPVLRVHALELRVLRLELLHSLELRDAHPTVLRSPVEVGCTADPVLPRQLAQCDAGFAFLQDRDDL